MTASWTPIASIPTPVYGSTSQVINGKLYVVSGYNGGHTALNQVYDFATNTWTTKAPIPKALYQTQSVVYNGLMYVIAGQSPSDYSGSVNVYAYDPVANTWATKANIPISVYSASVALLDGKIYVIGGTNYNGYTHLIQIYDPVANTWTSNSSTGTPFTSFYQNYFGVINGKLYVAGGVINGTVNGQCWVFDPSGSGTWTQKSGMPTALRLGASVISDSKLYAAGGFNGSTSVNSFFSYDPSTDKWTTEPSLPVSLDYNTAAVYGGSIFSISGFTDSSVITANCYKISYNALPAKPTNVVIAQPVLKDSSANVSWTHNDPEGDSQQQYKFNYISSVKYKDRILADSPIAYYRLGDSSGPFKDQIGTANLVAYGTPVTGKPGAILGDTDTAVSFSSAGNDYAEVPATLTGAFSVGFWVKANATLPTNATAFANSDSPNNLGSFQIDSNGSASWRLQVDATGSTVTAGLFGAISTTAFVFLVITCDSGGIQMYYNGDPVGSKYTGFTSANAVFDLYRLARNRNGTVSGDVTLDEVAIWDHVLTAAQIKAQYLIGSSGSYSIELPAVSSSAQSGSFSASGLAVGPYQIQVATADTGGFGPWSDLVPFTVVQQQAANLSAVPAILRAVVSSGSYPGIAALLAAVPARSVNKLESPSFSAGMNYNVVPAKLSLKAPLAIWSTAASVYSVPSATPFIFGRGGQITIYWNGLTAVSAGIRVGIVEPTRTVYIRPASPVYTEQDYRDRFTSGFTRITRRVEILNSDGTTLWDDKVGNKSRLISGSVSVDYTRDERRSLDLELANFDRALVHQPGGFWYDKIVKCYRGIEFYDQSGVQSYEVQLGVFLLDRVAEARFPKTVKITARDYTKKCLLSKLTQATAFASTDKVVDVIAALASNSGVHDRIFPNDDTTLGVDYTFDRDTSRWEAMKQIATAFSYELFFDASGYLVLRKFIDPTLGPISHEFLTGPSVGNLVDWEKSADDSRIFNHVSVIGSDNDSIPVWYDAINDNPQSPTNINILGDRTQTYQSDLITTTQQAQDLATSMLSIASLEDYQINMTSIVYPWLEAGEIVRFVDPDAVGNQPDRFLLTNISIPMGLEPMTATGSRVLIVS